MLIGNHLIDKSEEIAVDEPGESRPRDCTPGRFERTTRPRIVRTAARFGPEVADLAPYPRGYNPHQTGPGPYHPKSRRFTMTPTRLSPARLLPPVEVPPCSRPPRPPTRRSSGWRRRRIVNRVDRDLETFLAESRREPCGEPARPADVRPGGRVRPAGREAAEAQACAVELPDRGRERGDASQGRPAGGGEPGTAPCVHARA